MDQVYASLPLKAPGDIRLIKIHPACENEAIELTLLAGSLNDPALKYEALSYTWGNEGDQLCVTCNGEQMKVTRNLHSSLRRLRNEHEVRTLWIDAVSINQKDLSERAEQVKIMRQIYAKAKVTLADLGEEVENQQDLFKLLFALDKVLDARKDDTLPIDVASFETIGLPRADAPGWVAWQKLLARPYFVRLWIIQEFAVSTEVYFLLGVNVFPWWNLYHFINRMQVHGIAEDQRQMANPDVALAAVQGKNAIRNLHFQRDRVMANDPRKMDDLLWLGRFVQAKDPKDRIFAILGLVTDVDVNQPGLEIKYDKSESTAQLYTRVSHSLLTSNPNILEQFLYEAGSALRPRIRELASWIPDWSTPRAGSPLGGLANVVNYAAASSRPQKFSLASTSTALYIEGAVIDKVASMIAAFQPDTSSIHDDTFYGVEVVKWLSAAIALRSKLPLGTYDATGESVNDAFWRTLIGNKTHLDTPAPDSYASQFAALLVRQQFAEEAIERAERTNSSVVVQDNTGRWATAQSDSTLYRQALQNMMLTKSFALTDRGRMGIVPGESRVGDWIVLLSGTAVPFVVRKKTTGQFELVGECYIHGVMRGEMIDSADATWEMLEIW